MSDDDKRLAAWIAACCIVGAVAVLLVTALTRSAHAAALLDMGGQKIVVLTGDEFMQLMQGKSAEIEALQLELARVKKGCPET